MSVQASVTGIFANQATAEAAADNLVRAGFPTDRVVLLTGEAGVFLVTVSAADRYPAAEDVLRHSHARLWRPTVKDGDVPGQANQHRWVSQPAPKADALEQAAPWAPASSDAGTAASYPIDASEAEWLEQQRGPDSELQFRTDMALPIDVPEADCAEQLIPAYLDPDENESSGRHARSW